MKLFVNLHTYQADILFKMVKTVPEYMEKKLRVLEYIRYWHGNLDIRPPYLCVDTELKRAFMLSKDSDKLISIGFEFEIGLFNDNLKDSNNYVLGVWYGETEVTDKAISGAHSLISFFNIDEGYDPNWQLSLIEDEAEMDIDEEGVSLFEFIRNVEAGYLRYDDKPEEEKPLVHPRYHIDVNYTPHVSYKIGLGKAIGMNEFMQMINPNQKCAYLQIEHKMFDPKD